MNPQASSTDVFEQACNHPPLYSNATKKKAANPSTLVVAGSGRRGCRATFVGVLAFWFVCGWVRGWGGDDDVDSKGDHAQNTGMYSVFDTSHNILQKDV